MNSDSEQNFEELEKIIDDLAGSLAESFFYASQILGKIVETTERYYDGSHSRFVAEKSAQVASDIGMNDADAMTIKIAAQLHDIGKVGLPETCLFKFPGEMADSENTIYSRHPELGYNILQEHPNFGEIAEIILQHHEKLDGSGFPRFLTKGSIHIGAKIIGVVNYYHNQMHKRQRMRNDNSSVAIQYNSSSAYLQSTRNKYSSTMNYLTRKAGILYESKIVSVFTDIMESERKQIGLRSVMRIAINALEPNMLFAEDYFTSFGMLIAAKGELTTTENIRALKKFYDSGELPHKILVMK